jgi:hypothetical protein
VQPAPAGFGVRRKPQRKPWADAAGWPLHPLLRAAAEQFLFMGPVFGLLSGLYGFHLQSAAPLQPDPLTHAVIRQVQSFHGHFQHAYYITPQQNTLWWLLTGPAIAWLILVVLTLMALGMRRHYRQQP